MYKLHLASKNAQERELIEVHAFSEAKSSFENTLQKRIAKENALQKRTAKIKCENAHQKRIVKTH
jgi:hypothetical protein